MQSKISTFAKKLAESGWLAALLIVPLLFNVYSERVFEEDKIPLMRSISLLVAVTLVVWVVERGRSVLKIKEQPFWKHPVVTLALALLGSYILSTIFSIVPRISLWGAYIRRQGLYTWAAYMVIFFAILFLVRERRQVERILTLILLTSVPASLYAFLQNRDLDFLPWGGDVVRRVSSTAGNPIFIAAYLIMVYPFTLMRTIEHFKRLLQAPQEDDTGQSNYLPSALLSGAYLFLLVLQTMTILFSLSRGPWLGLLVGLSFFGILYGLRHSRPLTLLIVGTTLAGILFLVTLNLPNSPLAPLRENRYVGRLGQVFDLERRTAKVRVLIWGGSVELLADNPERLLVGHGPESMYVAFNRYYPPELATVEKRNASPDRAHNETFDALVMTGLLGFLAQTLLFITLIFYILKWLGLIRSRAQRWLFSGLVLAGSVGGIFLPYLLDGGFRLSGVGLPAGIVLGLVAYLLWYAVTHLAEVGTVKSPHTLLLTALLSAVIAHFVEAHFGIAIAVTRLYFWIYAGIAIVLGLGLVSQEDRVAPVSASAGTAASKRRGKRKRRRGAEPSDRGSILNGTLLGLSLMMALMLIVMTFNFYTPSVDFSSNRFSIIWLFMGTWLFGALSVTAESAFEQQDEERWLERVAVYAAVTLVTWAIFAAVYIPWVNSTGLTGSVNMAQLLAHGSHMANNITWVYLFTFAIVGLSALALQSDIRLPGIMLRPPEWQVMGYATMLVAIVPVIVVTNLNVSRADVYNKQASGYKATNLDAARVLYQEALRLQPDEDRYFLNLGAVLMQQARASETPQERVAHLREAREVLEQARENNPLNTDHTRNMASLHRAWASMAGDEAQKEEHLDRAHDYYAAAIELSPNNADLWNDWAGLLLERGHLDEATEKLQRSLALDDQWATTHLLYGNVLYEKEDLEGALGHYQRAVELEPNSLQAHSSVAFILSRLDRTTEAIEVSQRALEIAPNDFNTLKNLALLYQDAGNVDRALASARQALEVARPEDKAMIEDFIRRLSEEQAGDTTGG